MIWLTWRQFRTQAAVVFGALAVLALVLTVTGLHLRHLYDASGIATCTTRGDCDPVTSAFMSNYSLLRQLLGPTVLVLPAITGIFWGAPLVARELESGTYRLAWTQSVSRTRWLTGKLTVVGLASIAASGLLSLLVTWWSSPIDRVNAERFKADIFNERGITPIGYAAFAFALGLVAGLLIRRTLPAMATTLVGYIAAQVAVINWIRPNLRAPLHATGALQPLPGAGAFKPGAQLTKPGDWIISSHILDATGHATNTIRIGPDAGCVTTRTCLAGYREVLTYQPAGRYWPFQWYETSIYLSVALVLVGFTFWLIKR
ncbi:MAG: hypothetical protein QOE71_3455 [Pseudonocardiales bacterium]|jgi:hypothetical protein|nr:hypothetical protein [Pseudonocardiales bacterium]